MGKQTVVAAMLAKLGAEIQDVDEETFDIFSQPIPSQDLGMVDAKAALLLISVCGRDFEIAQSPGILQSSRAGGTTGAAVWRTSVAFAEWMGSPSNLLFGEGVLDSSSTVLELGAGISGILPCLLAHKVRRICATDQPYILKTLRENITANSAASSRGKKGRKGRHQNAQSHASNVDVFSLDWENDDAPSVMSVNGVSSGVEAILVCDCVFNYALIKPLIQTCADICKLRSNLNQGTTHQPTVCVVAQQLRQPEVFEQWLAAFHQHFRVWRLDHSILSASMREGSGFVVHLGILREQEPHNSGDSVRLG